MIVARAMASCVVGFPFHPPRLRQACGFRLAHDGHDTRAIQEWLGHRHIQHTTRSTELTTRRFKDFWRQEDEPDEARRNPGETARLSGHRGRWASPIEGAEVMAQDTSDQGAKDQIKKGMDESGKGQVKGGGQAGKGGAGHGADPGKLTEGMAEAGSGTPTGGEGSGKPGGPTR